MKNDGPVTIKILKINPAKELSLAGVYNYFVFY